MEVVWLFQGQENLNANYAKKRILTPRASAVCREFINDIRENSPICDIRVKPVLKIIYLSIDLGIAMIEVGQGKL